MKKIRLKQNCGLPHMSTPYGLIAHEWVDVKDDTYIYNEMEVFEEAKPEPKVEAIAEEEPVVEEQVVEEEIVETKPPFKKKVKKKK